jgi:hypothetical protein
VAFVSDLVLLPAILIERRAVVAREPEPARA